MHFMDGVGMARATGVPTVTPPPPQIALAEWAVSRTVHGADGFPRPRPPGPLQCVRDVEILP